MNSDYNSRNSEPKYIFCEVAFEHSYSRYTYIADSDDYKPGDLVFVPVGKDNEEKISQIKSVKYLSAEEAPYPIEKTKHIIRKFNKDKDSFGAPPLVLDSIDMKSGHNNDMMHSKSACWIQKTHLFRADEYICSSCQASYKEPYSKCPSCSAHMKKSKYDPNWVDEIETMSAMMDDNW